MFVLEYNVVNLLQEEKVQVIHITWNTEFDYISKPKKRVENMTHSRVFLSTGSPSSLYEPHKEHNMASNYKGLYVVLYKISMKVVKSET